MDWLQSSFYSLIIVNIILLLMNPDGNHAEGTVRKYHDALTMTSHFPEGVWGEDDFCPPDEYVIGMQLKGVKYQGSEGRRKRDTTNSSDVDYNQMEIGNPLADFFKAWGHRLRHGVELRNHYPLDDYGLISIRLICAPHWKASRHGNNTSVISSAFAYVIDPKHRPKKKFMFLDVIPFGLDPKDLQQTDSLFCADSFANRFNVKQEARQGTADDSGITNFKLTCADGQQLSTKMNHEPGEWGHGDKACSRGNAICGIRTKLELDHHDDDTGLNNLIIYCCPPPKLADESEICEPEKKLKLVDTFTNKGFTVSKHTFRVREGLSRQKGSRQLNKNSQTEDMETGFGIEIETSAGVSEFSKTTLKTRFDQKWGTSNTAESETETSESDVFTEEVEREHEAEVLPRSIIKLYQEVKTCGTFTLSSRKLERRDENLQHGTYEARSGTGSIHQLLTQYYLTFGSLLLLISLIRNNF